MIINEYNRTDRVMHTVSQYLARISKSYLDQKDDDSHTNLGFDSIGNRVTGRWIQSGLRKYLPAIELAPLALIWLDELFSRLYTIPLAGRPGSAVEEDIRNSLAKTGLDPLELKDQMHYEIPAYPETKEIIPELTPGGTAIWSQYRGLANSAAVELLGFIQGESEIRIWPHHFDTGIYVNTVGGTGLGFGLAMEDKIGGSPYFYIAAYPGEGEIEYHGLPALNTGEWIISDSWKGAVLPLSSLKPFALENDRIALRQFIKLTTSWYLNI